MNDSVNNTQLDSAMLRWLSEFSPQGLLVTDAALEIRSCNRWFEKHAEKGERDLIGRNLLDVFPELAARGFDRYYREALGGQSRVLSHRLHKYYLPMKHAGGALTGFGEMQQSARISPLFDGDRVVGTITVIEDVTERVAREMELDAQLEERERLLKSELAARRLAEENSRLKDEFLATVSHEIRTPLHSINGWTQILLNGNLGEEEIRQALETIKRNVRSQSQIIEDLLDVSRIIAGQMRLEMQPVDLSESLASAVESVSPAARAKEVELIERLEAAGAGADVRRGIFVMGDPSRLQQIFWNLLTNAVKFTPKGGRVEISLREAGPAAEIVVRDTGQGMPADFLPFVFEPFRQADGSSKRKHGGLGLGLSIVKNLVAMHGGSIGAESGGLGEGASFTVILPLLRAAAEEDETGGERPADAFDKTAMTDMSGIRVLVVDDDADSREMLKFFLENHKAQITMASSAPDALSRFSDSKPDILISDLGMPEMDGYDLIRQIRSSAADGDRRTPAIALTGYATAEEQKRVREAGFDVHIAKPVDYHQLLQVINSLLSREP